MNIVIIFYLFCWVSPLSAFFDYDKAVNAAQHNNWESAHQLLTELVVNKPDNPSILYDAGIAAFNIKNFSQAQAYFQHAAESKNAPIELKEQAYFNLGNTQVELKQLEQAIASYEKVLEINPNNERAKHNLEVVKKMLEQQKQQQQQEKQQEKDKKEKEKEQQKQDQQQQETSDQDESGSGQGNESQEQQEGNNEQQQGDQGKQRQEKNNNGAQSKQSKGSQEQEQKQDRGQQEKAQQQAARDNLSDKNKGNEQPQPAAGKEKQQGNQELKTTKNGGKSGVEKREAWLAQLLQENEQEDAQLNKQMMKAMVGNQLAGRDGQNCW
ncbi:MAG TPA: tetratricopeptide repeat protein [Candidatus Babeliales bacterium]|nr:tetratricopeptide repeat protein [Candidatus Babeliales bacterium]